MGTISRSDALSGATAPERDMFKHVFVRYCKSTVTIEFFIEIAGHSIKNVLRFL